MKKNVKEVMSKIIDAGYEVYLVGGYVRDYLLNIESIDYDMATNAKPADLMKIWPNIETTNYGSIVLKYKGSHFEITTFRIEKKYLQNRFPTYEYTDSLDNDIKRRDFTINAIYMDINENIIDKVNGKDDLNNKVLKMVGNPNQKLEEDALRILRAIRFATKYNLTIDNTLDDAIKSLSYLVSNLSYNRKKEELDKLFICSNLAYGIKLIKKYNIDKYLNINGLDNLKPVNNLLGIWAQLDVDDDYPFKKSEKNLITKIKIYLQKDILSPLVLYKAGLYIAMIVAQIRYIDIKKINIIYNNLPIKQRKDIMITSNEIINLLGIKPGKIITNIYHDIEYEILIGNLLNDKKNIVSYILKKYK